MLWRCTAVLFLLAGVLATCPSLSCAEETTTAQPTTDYLRDIKPLLKRACYRCHGAAKQTSGLRLDTARAALIGGDSGEAVVPGESAESLLYLVVSGSEDYEQMPPEGEGERLKPDEVALIKRWIDGGAKFPEQETPDDSAGSDHWSFQKPVRPEVSTTKDSAWIRNEIDAFVLARLEENQIAPSPEADRITLIRRLTFDLLGLPPTPEEVQQFLADTSPNAYEKLVDRLLSSPHYGERWGRHWLDAARYADSNGYTIDGSRNMWHYRDWVINALNADMPFDQFTIQQLAGDMLPEATREQMIATGFHRNTLINEEGGTDQEQFRIDAVADRLHTTGAVWLGLTLECARCHTHKYDPITQREYYEMFAFFDADDDYDLNFPPPADKAAEFQKKLDKFNGEIAELDKKIAEAYGTPAEENGELKKLINNRTRKMRAKPKSPAGWAMVMKQREQPRLTHVHKRGNFLDPGDEVTAAVPAVLPPLPKSETHNRLDFAHWLVDGNNPLTARVTVNRMWQHYFGSGLVQTENDFGTQGERPSHPQLLDWLATEFIARGWSMKAMHKLIVTSATYRQASVYREEVAQVDPANRLLARQARLRLEAEIIRDAALATSGLLTRTIGGTGVFPPQPDGVYAFTQNDKGWKANTGPERYRRGMYTYFWRSQPFPALMTFDFPESNVTCTRRVRSNTPLQALTLANDIAFVETARALAQRILKEASPDDEERIRFAFQLCLAREPSSLEMRRLALLIRQQREAFAADQQAAAELMATDKPTDDTIELAAWTTFSRVLMNLDEFITRE